ncbi:MAG: carboxy terminal-processing peptidase [Opitutaceae bacterium]
MILRLSIILVLIVLSYAHAEEAPVRNFTETKVMSDETRLVVQLLETVHYKNEQMEQKAFQTLLTDYMAQLDTHHLFFLDSDRDYFLKTYARSIGNELRENGSLEAPFRIYATYHARAVERIDWILSQLDGPFAFPEDGSHRVVRPEGAAADAIAFDFDTAEEYIFDRSEAEWPLTSEQSDDLWRRRIKFELLEDLLNEKTIEESRDTVRKRYERLAKNLDEIGESEIQELFLSTLARMYDPHSTFFSADTLEDFSISMRLSLVGIGALLANEDGYCVIKELIPGGPAFLSKQLKPNDKIVEVAQGSGESTDVIGMNLRKVVNLIRGDKGTEVRLTVLPGDATDSSVRKTVALQRDVVQLNASRASAEIIEVPGPSGPVSVGVIDVPSFYGPVEEEDLKEEDRRSATQDVEELLGKLEVAGVEGIILDLRQNGGGLLSEAVDMTGLFIRQGPVVQVRDSNGQIYVKPDLDPKIAYNGPLLVLTSRFSASASEIVAGALQNYGRALIIGDSSTHGKGTVQAVLEMKSFIPRQYFSDAQKTGAAKLTVQKFYLPNGFSTQNKGVIPDVALPSIDDYLPIGESDLPNAMAWDTIRPARFSGFSLRPDLLTSLKEHSTERQNSLEEFQFLNRRINWFRAKQDEKAISLNLETRRTQKVIDEAFREEMDAEQTKLADLNYPSTEVLLDSVIKDKDSESTEVAAVVSPDLQTDDESGDGSTADEDKSPPAFDIHLRESLRILVDALGSSRNPEDWVQVETLTAQRETIPSAALR